jgi:isopenicillin N synthase-like dioxygenase
MRYTPPKLSYEQVLIRSSQVARDEFQSGRWVFPATIEPEKERMTRTLKSFNDAAQTMLAELCASVDLKIPELSDDPTVPSDTALKLLYKPPIHEVGKVILGRHTDFGLLTLLWYDEVTTELPICDQDGTETGAWEKVASLEGCILVNVADELAARSGGRLHSTVHRVICPEGPKRPKNGLVYFLRPYKTYD